MLNININLFNSVFEPFLCLRHGTVVLRPLSYDRQDLLTLEVKIQQIKQGNNWIKPYKL